MTTKLGPWDVGFPVRFRANGDTVHDAFYKHIQEIERIYGLLNALDSNKLDWSDMQAHIQSANPHPNLTISGDKITGAITGAKIPIDNVTGNIPASRVYGTLTNAYIDHSHVNGLSNLINSKVDNAVNENKPIEESSITESGYVKLNGGLMIQWGRSRDYAENDEDVHSFTFPTPFTTQCFNIVATPCAVNVVNKSRIDKAIIIYDGTITNTGFDASIQACSDSTNGARSFYMYFVAFGI